MGTGVHNLQRRVIPNMLWKRVHRPALRFTGTGSVREPRVRPALRRTGDRALADPAEIAPDQWHGRTLQRSHRRRA